MMTFILFLALFAADIPHQNELKQTVSAYWTLMVKGEKATALKYVLQASQNDFVSRVEPKVQSWRYVTAEPTGPKEAAVTVEIEAFLKGASPAIGFQKVQKRETWVWEGKAWKLKVDKPSMASIAPLASTRREEAPLPKVLQISPVVVHVQFFNKVQQSHIRIVNGTALPAQLLSAKVDESRFRVVEQPTLVQPGQSADLVLEYKGTENDKNLESQITVVVKNGDQEKLFQVPIIYNYLSDGARGLLGLTEEQARNLKRGDKVAPVLKQPTPADVPKLPNQQ